MDGLTLTAEFEDTLRDIEQLADSYADLGREFAEAKRDYERERAVAMRAIINGGAAQSVADKLARGERAVLEAGQRMDESEFAAKAEQMRYSALLRKADYLRDVLKSEYARPSERGWQ